MMAEGRRPAAKPPPKKDPLERIAAALERIADKLDAATEGDDALRVVVRDP